MEKKIEDNDLEKVTGGGIIAIDPRVLNPNLVPGFFNCPTCGMPLAADKGTTSGMCPYCGENIVVEDFNKKDIRII